MFKFFILTVTLLMQLITGSGFEQDDVSSQVDAPVFTIVIFKGGLTENLKTMV